MAKKHPGDRLRRWVAGKPLGLAALAIDTATFAEDLGEWLTKARESRMIDKFRFAIDHATWMRLYRSHRSLSDSLGVIEGFDAEGELSATELAGALRTWDKFGRDEKMSAIEVFGEDDFLEIVNDSAKAFLNAISDMITAAEDWAKTGQSPGDMLTDAQANSAELQFLMRVWFPCWILYRVYPCELLRAARLGRIEAITALVRIDRGMVGDRLVAQHIHEYWHKPNRANSRKVAAAMSAPDRPNVSRKKLKVALAGYIAKASHDLGHPLLEPDLRELFDGVAALKGKLRDRDLPPSPEALQKALQRERPKWVLVGRRTKIGG